MRSGRRRSGGDFRLGVAATTLIVLAGCREAPNAPDLSDPHEPGARIRTLLEGAEGPVLAIHTGDTVHLGPPVLEFYGRRGYEPAWTDRSGLLPRGMELMRALDGAVADGLDPRRYHGAELRDVVRRVLWEHEEELPVGDLLGNVDMLLTDAFLRFTTDLALGSVDPEEAGLPWRIQRGEPMEADAIDALVREDDLERALDRLRPAAPFYHHLREALGRYQAVVKGGGWPTVGPGEELEEGARGRRVLELRRRLAAEGDPRELALLDGAPDPERYDRGLAAAVESFQARHGLEPDGVVGPTTLRELDVPAEERLLSLRLNLDRWRWLPRELGDRYVLVNVAGFEMAVMEGQRAALRMNVIVGQEAWRTPVFQDTLEYVVVNPFWNVPRSIARRDIIPSALRDPGYLARNGYEVRDPSGRRVDASRVDLRSERYTFRQRPGSENALGAVKFLFPNDMNIYLHDTPARHLFDRTSRAFSSGCIRVEKPRELAEYLFRTSTSRPPGTFDELRATGREQWVALEEKLPIYILYFTAWAEADGSVRFYRDIYEHDSAVERVARERFGDPAPSDPSATLAERAVD